jgi:hypothetical protein
VDEMNHLLSVGFAAITVQPVEPRFAKLKLEEFLKIPKRKIGDGERGSASHKIKESYDPETSSADKSELLTK